MTYLKVRLLNDSMDSSTADIVPRQAPDGSVVFSVYSDNPKMKSHLEKLLTMVAYIAAPGRNETNFFADAVLEVQPNTIYYANALPEILSWRGYDVSVETAVHKSIDFEDFFAVDTLKASESQPIIYNAQGERVVKYVPAGYVAVHSDGRVVAGGKYLNANIDKEGTQWQLVQNPHEKSSPEQRKQAKEYMDVGLQEYHPGVEEGAYAERGSDESPYHKIERDYKPKGKTLEEHFFVGTPDSKVEVSFEFPSFLEPGNVVYSPQTGQAFDSKFWPPEEIDYEKFDWYVFSGSELSDDEKDFYAPIRGLSPELISGVDKGIVQSEKDLDVSAGFKLGDLKAPEGLGDLGNTSAGLINPNPVPDAKYEIREMLSPDWKKLYKKAKDKLFEIASLAHGKLDESLVDLQLPKLRGSEAVFQLDLYPHQKAIVAGMVEESQYEVFGGPRGWHGYFLNVKMGLGKTAAVSAANAIMRNRGRVKNGTQTTLVTAPNKNLFVWQSEIGKFLGEHAVVIDGDRESRVEQWEQVLDQANRGELPAFIIFGASKFRYVTGDNDFDEQDKWELDTDAKYIQLLSMGGASGDKKVEGNHVGILTVDESGQYVNPDSARHRALHELIDSVYHGKGIVWTLNGTISGNSATDTISELSFVNKFVRDNYLPLAQEYTKTDRNSARESKEMGRRIWKDHNRLVDFFHTFGAQIFSLDGKTVAGENYGFVQTDDALTPIGKEWSRVYFDAERKLVEAQGEQVGNRAMGLLSILIGASMGAVSPERMLEYDLGTKAVLKSAKNYLSDDEMNTLSSELKAFFDEATESYPTVGRLPLKGLSPSERNEVYRSKVSAENRQLISNIVEGWYCPYTETLLRNIQNDFEQNSEAGKNMKVGIANFSRVAVNKLARRLRDVYPASEYLIQVVDGGVNPEEVGRIQKRHQDEKERNVITLVTGAGVYGLSLPADRSYRAPTWNSAKGGQYDARFHRKAEQNHLSTVVVPEGITQYMRELEQRKGSMAAAATNVLLDIDDSQDELVINSNSVSRLVDKLSQYRPRVLEGSGSGD